VDALVALSQRTVWVATWTPDGEGYRTLTNSNGQTALPVFTTVQLLENAAQSLAWVGAPVKEIGAREALRHAVAHNLSFVVVDIGTSHMLEIDQDEIQPLLTPQARRESQGPYAAVGRISSTMMQAVKPTPSKGMARAAPPPTNVQAPELSRPPPGPEEHQVTTESRPPPPMGLTVSSDPMAGASATFGSGSSVTVQALDLQPTDDLLKGLADFLRGYPEVEWAAIAAASRGPAGFVPTIGLRIDAGFRQRVNEIIGGIRQAGEAFGASLDVLLLDDAEVMREARSAGILFYPWRQR
jgi:hypothetical protein